MQNQNPEQLSRDLIDKHLNACGWSVQSKKKINLGESLGVAVREYQTDVGPADYVLFVDKKPVGVIEAKKEEDGFKLTQVEDQSTEYANAKLKYLNNDPLPFVYESTGELTKFTDYRDLKPRSRPIFSFHKPETLRDLLKTDTLRNSLQTIRPLPTEGLRDCQISAITNLEKSFKKNHPKAFIQMATGSGKMIDRNFQTWVMGKQAGALKFNNEQMQWLRMIKDHVATSFHIERDDFEYEPFAPGGGLGKMYQLFGEQMEPIIKEINIALAA